MYGIPAYEEYSYQSCKRFNMLWALKSISILLGTYIPGSIVVVSVASLIGSILSHAASSILGIILLLVGPILLTRRVRDARERADKSKLILTNFEYHSSDIAREICSRYVSDPKDKALGVNALLNALDVDSSTSSIGGVSQLYQILTTNLLRSGHTLALLGIAAMTRLENTVSWILDWNANSSDFWLPPDYYFALDQTKSPEFEINLDNKTLKAKGYRLGQISHLSKGFVQTADNYLESQRETPLAKSESALRNISTL